MSVVWLDDPGNAGWAPPILQPGQTTTFSINVQGAEMDDFVLVSTEIPSFPLNNKIGFEGHMIRPGVVGVILKNFSDEPYHAPPATWHARVMKRTWMVSP